MDTSLQNSLGKNPTRKIQRQSLLGKTINGCFQGEDVFVVGGGPSLKDFRWDLLDSRRNIRINRSILERAEGDAFFTEDLRFVQRFHEHPAFQSFSGTKIVHCLDESYRKEFLALGIDLVLVPRRNEKLWSSRIEDGLSYSSNSGIGAINLAEIMGASRIFLLGFDCTKHSDKSNYHNDYPPDWWSGSDQLRSFASDLEFWVKPHAKTSIINVINPEMPSAVKSSVFPHMTFSEVFPEWTEK